MNNNRDLFDGMALFCEVVTHGSFAAAAKRFGHTASHVSRAVARLEQRLGVRLLHRTTRRLSLTEPGQVYFDEARRLVEEARHLEDRLGALGGRPFGVLRMSVPVIFARAHFGGWAPEFMWRHGLLRRHKRSRAPTTSSPRLSCWAGWPLPSLKCSPPSRYGACDPRASPQALLR